jgi:hypothetical protein
MYRHPFTLDRNRTWDLFVGLGAAAYFVGFFVAVHFALRKLVY